MDYPILKIVHTRPISRQFALCVTLLRLASCAADVSPLTVPEERMKLLHVWPIKRSSGTLLFRRQTRR
jgi:hypothetical protein